MAASQQPCYFFFFELVYAEGCLPAALARPAHRKACEMCLLLLDCVLILYICVLILLYVCPHTIYVSSYYYMCVFILLYYI